MHSNGYKFYYVIISYLHLTWRKTKLSLCSHKGNLGQPHTNYAGACLCLSFFVWYLLHVYTIKVLLTLPRSTFTPNFNSFSFSIFSDFECAVIVWSMVDSSWATPLKKIDSPSPKNSELPTDPQLLGRGSWFFPYLCKGAKWLDVWQSFVDIHSWSEFVSVVVQSGQKTMFHSGPSWLWSIAIICPLFHNDF